MSNLETALDNYTHALANGAGYAALQVAFDALRGEHHRHAYAQYVGEHGNVAEGAHNVD